MGKKHSLPLSGLGLNLGCGPIMMKEVDGVTFINLDHEKEYQEIADQQSAYFMLMNLTKEFPKFQSPIAFVNMSQFLEHLNLPDAESVLVNCFNSMENGATIRVSVPDFETLLFNLRTNQMQKFENVQPRQWYNRYKSQTMKFALLLFGSLHEDGASGHRMCYDYSSLKELLENVGFVRIRRVDFDARYDAPVAFNHELAVVAEKP